MAEDRVTTGRASIEGHAALASTEAAPTRRMGQHPEVDELGDTVALPTNDVSAGRGGLDAEGLVEVSGGLPSGGGAERFETGPSIGSGGMGEVVLQIDRNIGRAVAKKTLHPEMHGAVSLQRFIREARVQGQLEHPAVVPVHDFGIDAEGRIFFTMKRIRGETLGQILERLAAHDRDYEARFSLHRLLSAFVQVCLAIEYAHKRGVIHRDLKPSNVMLGDFGEVYVLDWGLAKLIGRAGVVDDLDAASLAPSPAQRGSSPDMTSDGDFLGTPLYMAPEQILGRHAAMDGRADVFGLGAILFEILTLEPYRRGSSIVALLADVDSTAPVERPSERACARDIPSELDALCVAALAREASERLPSARALGDAVARYLEGDRDLAARRARASARVDSARARQGAAAGGRGAEVVLATREALQALALSPSDEEAQRLLVELVLEGSCELSPEASRAFAERDVDVRMQGFRRGIVGFCLWLVTFPLAALVGVRDWKLLVFLALLTVGCIGFAALVVRSPRASRSRAFALALAVATALIVVLGSAWLGPFVLTPLAACAASIMFLVHSTRGEARGLLAVWLSATLLPFALEWLHVVPPAYAFRDDEIVLHSRLLRLPEGPTLLFLAYTSVSFVGFLGYFVSQLRAKQRDAERRLFGQAWLLQHLFPKDASAPSEGRGAS